jgi:hypothetical protein
LSLDPIDLFSQRQLNTYYLVVRSPFSIVVVLPLQLRLLYLGSLFRSNTTIEICSKSSLSASHPGPVHVDSDLRQFSSEKMATTADVPLLIISENARSERRISPAWTIAQLKGRLEPITGVPASSQRLTLKVASWPDQNLQAVDQENTQLSAFTLQSYAELHVSNYSSVSTTVPNEPCTPTVRWASVVLSLAPAFQ